jgi:nicotinate-nucleotide adenylyltransferase
MANFAVKKFGFDKVIFIPAYIPPHKQLDSNLAAHRYNMVKMAVEKNLRFGISDIEYKSEGKSYTLITVKKIKELYNIEGRLNFIIGTDAFKNIKTWYKADELKDLVHFIVFPRGEDVIDPSEYLGYSFEVVDFPKIDISSTELRTVHKGETTKEVEEYIRNNGLYN